ncbi:MAG: GDP-mannose 4,6-dehydratase [Deltaproteobacteria bacterium]|nr:GDP-mannose 4,6-dehydratase [Deltaproteobacteria bacterium]
MKDNLNIKKILITGITGSGGSYLAEHIVQNHPGVEVHGIARWHSTSLANNLSAVSEHVVIHESDLNDFGSIFSVVRDVRPDAIFHLAAYANVRASFITPQTVLSNNIIGTNNLFEAIRLAGIDPIVLLCSSSEVYGQVDPKNVPITEECPTNPSSPYAVSKVAQDFLGWSYFVSYNMKIIRTRAFAYLNPRRSDLFASSFARQVARIEAGLQKELLHGNLDSVRTIVDVRDIMEAYWLTVLHCKPGSIYNIGGTKTLSVGEFLQLLIKKAKVSIPTRLDHGLLRPSDVTLQIPCTDKFIAATGWKPKYSFEESIDSLLLYWRASVARERF